MLQELAEISMTLARGLGAKAVQAVAEDPTTPEAQALNHAFNRAALTVRQTLALEARLRRGADLLKRQDRAACELARSETETQARRTRRHDQVAQVIEKAIRDQHHRDTWDRTRVEFQQRDAYRDDLADRPLDHHIATVCHRLGLKTDTRLWTHVANVTSADPSPSPRPSPPGGGGSGRSPETERAKAHKPRQKRPPDIPPEIFREISDFVAQAAAEQPFWAHLDAALEKHAAAERKSLGP